MQSPITSLFINRQIYAKKNYEHRVCVQHSSFLHKHVWMIFVGIHWSVFRFFLIKWCTIFIDDNYFQVCCDWMDALLFGICNLQKSIDNPHGEQDRSFILYKEVSMLKSWILTFMASEMRFYTSLEALPSFLLSSFITS